MHHPVGAATCQGVWEVGILSFSHVVAFAQQMRHDTIFPIHCDLLGTYIVFCTSVILLSHCGPKVVKSKYSLWVQPKITLHSLVYCS